MSLAERDGYSQFSDTWTVEPPPQGWTVLSGLYSAATAMDSAAVRHELVARNLAYAEHPGYRRQVYVGGTFESTLDEAAQQRYLRESLGTQQAESYIDFTPGPVQQTGRPLDLMLEGDGFFVVEGPDGPLYTRNGVFQLTGDGQLVTTDGLPVQGGGGPITIPTDASTEHVIVNPEGRVFAGDQDVGRLQLARFEQPELLIQVGVSLFEAPDDVAAEPSQARVFQGARELGNVSAVEELVRMIDGMRQYEAAARAMQTIAEAVEQNVQPTGA